MADISRQLGFVTLSDEAKALVTPAARDRARYGHGTIIPLFSNRGFLPFLRNLICSMRKVNVRNWMVIAMDNETCPALLGNPGLGEQSSCVHPYGGEKVIATNALATYRSVAFNRIVMQRPLWVHYLLTQGYSVIQCDLDIVFLRDPLPMLLSGRILHRPRNPPTLIAEEDAKAYARGHPSTPGRAPTYTVSKHADMIFQSEQ